MSNPRDCSIRINDADVKIVETYRYLDAMFPEPPVGGAAHD